MITFQEFYSSIKEMGSYVIESTIEAASLDKITVFIKHVNVNCQYNYNVISLINENNDTPSKQKTTKSLSSSICESAGVEENKQEKSSNKERDEKQNDSNSKDKTNNKGMIDDNITKALNALRSPRLSIPHSNEQSSTPESAKIPRYDDDCMQLHSEEKNSKYSNHGAIQSNLRNYTQDSNLKRWKSITGSKSHSQIDEQTENKDNELEEFIAIEKSCKDSDPQNSNKYSLNVSPQDSKCRSKSNKRHGETERLKQRISMKSQIYNVERDSHFKMKRGTLEEVECSLDHIKNAKHTKQPKTNRELKATGKINFATNPSEVKIKTDKISNKESDPEDYDKKLEEIQEKYKRALNIGSDVNTQSITKSKDKEPKKSNKDLPFTLDEFKNLKKQIKDLDTKDKNTNKTVKRQSKIDEKLVSRNSNLTKSKNDTKERSLSIKRSNKFESKESINKRQNFSKLKNILNI